MMDIMGNKEKESQGCLCRYPYKEGSTLGVINIHIEKKEIFFVVDRIVPCSSNNPRLALQAILCSNVELLSPELLSDTYVGLIVV